MFGYHIDIKRLVLATLAALIVGAIIGVIAGRLVQTQIIEKFIGAPRGKIVDQSNGSYKIVVPKSKIPQTDDARAKSTPISILPSHWEGGQTTAIPGASNTVFVSTIEKNDLLRTATSFLKRWETFRAGGYSYYNTWQGQLKTLVAPGSTNVLTRQESFAPSNICPHPICTIGSTWFAGYPHNGSFTIRAYDNNQAYLTGYGLVRYHDPTGNLNNKVVLREYALILVHTRDRWLIQRAVAETIK